MKKGIVLLSTFLLSFSLMTGCSTPNLTQNSSFNSVYSQSKYTIIGKAEFPSFNTKATLGDVGVSATVTILYPPDFETENLRNKAIATGLTNSSGVFSVNPDPNFIFEAGDIFVLEAINRKGGPGNKLMTIRTYIRWNGTSWESITTPGVYINTKTTALSIILGLRPDKATSNDIIGAFPVVDNSTQVNTINSFITTDVINQVVGLVSQGLNDEQDTVGSIRYDYKVDKYYRDKPAPKIPLYELAFTTNRGGATNIYTMLSNGTEIRPITSNSNEGVDYYSPIYSHNKSKIAFVFDEFTKSNIWMINPDGYGLVQVTSNNYFNSKPVWSPDDSKLAFNSDKDGGKLIIYDMNSLESIESSIGNADFSWSSWSPDSSKVLFTSKDDGDEEIYVMNSDGSGLTKLTDNTSSDHSPQWSPDGNKVAFISDRNGNEDLFVMDVDGNNQTGLTSSLSNESKPVWSPDGSKIAFEYDNDNQYDIYIVNNDGTNRTVLAASPADDYWPIWLNNYDILFVSARDSNREIYHVSIDDTNLLNLSNNIKNESLNSAFSGMD